MKLYNGRVGNYIYSLTIESARERQMSMHMAIMTVADKDRNVVNVFQRAYDSGLGSMGYNEILKDMRNIVRSV